MVRVAALWVGLSLVPISVAAQATTVMLRVTRDAVIVEQPRGDSVMLARVTPTTVLEAVRVQGEWYLVALPSSDGGAVRGTGWIHRGAIERLAGQLPAAQAPRAAVDLPSSPPPPRPVRSEQAFIQGGEGVLGRGKTELSFQGGFISSSALGESGSMFQLDGIAAYFVTDHIEVGVITDLVKVTGVDLFGSVAGAAAYNLAIDRPANGFIGGALGRGFGLGVLNPTIIELFGGVRAMMPGGGGALVVRPFYQRLVFSNDLLAGLDVNSFGVGFGVSIFF